VWGTSACEPDLEGRRIEGQQLGAKEKSSRFTMGEGGGKAGFFKKKDINYQGEEGREEKRPVSRDSQGKNYLAGRVGSSKKKRTPKSGDKIEGRWSRKLNFIAMGKK